MAFFNLNLICTVVFDDDDPCPLPTKVVSPITDVSPITITDVSPITITDVSSNTDFFPTIIVPTKSLLVSFHFETICGQTVSLNYTVEPPNKGQARFTSYGLCREVGLYSESMHINLELM